MTYVFTPEELARNIADNILGLMENDANDNDIDFTREDFVNEVIYSLKKREYAEVTLGHSIRSVKVPVGVRALPEEKIREIAEGLY